MASVRITQKGPVDHRVEVDGVDISRAVHAVAVRMSVKEFTTVELDLVVHDIGTLDVDHARILVPDHTRDALIALGWTPPSEDA